MARCPDCNKFVAVELVDPGDDLELSAEVDRQNDLTSEGTLTVEVRLVLTCQECGTELAETTQEVEAEFSLEHEEGCPAIGDEGLPELDVDGTAEPTDRYEGKGRYARHFWGAQVSATVRCLECSSNVEVDVLVEEQASLFENLV